MKNFNNIQRVYWMGLLLAISFSSCKYDYFPIPPGPVVPKATETLEARYVNSPPNTINNSYWSKADFHKVTCENLSTGHLYSDGLLNMTGTYNGIPSFNNSTAPDLTMKAAYDSQNVYILMEWTDLTLNVSNATWLRNGPADPLKSDTAGGWTSQKNNDKVSLMFEIDPAAGSAGTFANVGCAASCHNDQMKPQSGKLDIWDWNLALAEPLGYAGDMVTDATSGLSYDAGQVMFARNTNGTTDRSGPAYEWDGNVQNVTKANGSATILDPAYFLLNKTPFTGDVAAGETAYHNAVYGCYHCHGENGEGGGEYGDGPSFRSPTVNRYSRSSFDSYASTSSHTGFTYYNQLSASEKVNVIAFIRSLSGLPGYYLQEPTGSNTDIKSVTNTSLVNVNTYADHAQYKVLLIRKLNTGNPDDAVFDLSQKIDYVFGVALMDNDGKNHIGSLKETLKFLDK